MVADQTIKELRLPNGSAVLNDIKISPDGNYATVTHIVASFQRAATQVSQGWMDANALTIVDMDGIHLLATVLLDTPSRGAANPWGLAWTADGRKLIVAHAGTHEVSVIDFPALIAELAKPEAAYGATRRTSSVLAFKLRWTPFFRPLV